MPFRKAWIHLPLLIRLKSGKIWTEKDYVAPVFHTRKLLEFHLENQRSKFWGFQVCLKFTWYICRHNKNPIERKWKGGAEWSPTWTSLQTTNAHIWKFSDGQWKYLIIFPFVKRLLMVWRMWVFRGAGKVLTVINYQIILEDELLFISIYRMWFCVTRAMTIVIPFSSGISSARVCFFFLNSQCIWNE